MLGKITVEIGGKTRHLTFGQNAWYLFTKMKGITTDQIRPYMFDQLNNPDVFRDLIYCSMQVESMRNKEIVDYNEFDVGDWLDESKETDIANVIVCIFESLSLPTKDIKKKLGVK